MRILTTLGSMLAIAMLLDPRLDLVAQPKTIQDKRSDVSNLESAITDARKASDSTTCHSTPSRGLSWVSICEGKCWVLVPPGVVRSSWPCSLCQWSSRSAGKTSDPSDDEDLLP